MSLELVVFQVHVVDFVQIRPFEELPHSKCSTLRGGLGRSTPGVLGVFLVVVFDLDRNPIENLPQKPLLPVYPIFPAILVLFYYQPSLPSRTFSNFLELSLELS